MSNKQLRVLELYSGTQSIGKQFRAKGHKVLSVELEPKFTEPPWNLDQWTISVADLKEKEIIKKLGGVPDVIWASPLCTTCSIAAISKHRSCIEGFGNTIQARKDTNILIPKSEDAKEHDQLLLRTLHIIRNLRPKYYFIENPVGGMRKNSIMQGVMYRYTVTYCQYAPPEQYGLASAKPTDLWTNHPNPDFKPRCFNGDNCHVSAPRGSKTGTQGKKDNLERSIIPELLCKHIVDICEE